MKTDASPSSKKEKPFSYDIAHNNYICKGCGWAFEADEIWASTVPSDKWKFSQMKHCPMCGYPKAGFGEPDHRYAHGPVECIDAIKAALSPEEWRGFVKGNVLKYVWREQYKGGDCDLEKARDYLARYLKKGAADEPVEEA